MSADAGIPEAARQRLEEVRRAGGSFFTSDLSVPEFLVVREAGLRPVTQVMGSCFYHVGWQGTPFVGGYQSAWTQGQTFELETQTEAWNEARRLALERLAEEARLAGADAVIGVRLQRGAYDWAAGLIEFVAVGTAVRSERYELGGDPVLSNLSGQEFAQLLHSGWWPAGLVAATTVSYVVTGWNQQQRTSLLGGGWQNQELPDFTRGVYQTRTQTMLRLQRQAHELGAGGVVGVLLEQQQEAHEANNTTNLMITMHVLGTAIVEIRTSEEPPPIYVALPLSEETR